MYGTTCALASMMARPAFLISRYTKYADDTDHGGSRFQACTWARSRPPRRAAIRACGAQARFAQATRLGFGRAWLACRPSPGRLPGRSRWWSWVVGPGGLSVGGRTPDASVVSRVSGDDGTRLRSVRSGQDRQTGKQAGFFVAAGCFWGMDGWVFS